MLPCNVVVREETDKSITVSFMDPEAVLKLVEKAKVSVIGGEVKALLKGAAQALRHERAEYENQHTFVGISS